MQLFIDLFVNISVLVHKKVKFSVRNPSNLTVPAGLKKMPGMVEVF